MASGSHLSLRLCGLAWALAGASFLGANVAGGGTGTGPNVTVTDNGTTVVLANGIVSFTVVKSNGNLSAFSYNGVNLLAGGHGGGSFYVDGSGGPTLSAPVYTLTVNPATNGGNQAEVWLQSTQSPMDAGLYYDLLRGQQGIYDTFVLSHPAAYPAYPGAELRTNMYVGSIFDWICVDPYRFRPMASPNDTTVAVTGAPPEVMQFTSGLYNGSTGCKYSYSVPLGPVNAYGWASSTTQYGIWQTFPSHEYLDGGPLHRELTAHLGNTLLDMFGGGHYGFGLSQGIPAGTAAFKVFGPAFIYANQYAGAATNVSAYAQALYADAQAQAAAEQAAWPYSWFTPQAPAGISGPVYPARSGRGSVSGNLAVNDPDDSGAPTAGLWVGLAPDDGGVDFQQQYLTYQFWTRTGPGGTFSIPNVLPGTYNLWAFGPGVLGTFQRTGVSVAAGQAVTLGTVTWSPSRLGPTVWQIGVPDRSSEEFRNGEHEVAPYGGVLPPYAGGAPYNSPAAWAAFLAYPSQFPQGVSYTVGLSSDASDWNYCQPTVPNGSGGYTGSASRIFFKLAQAPAAGAQARLTLDFAAVYAAACILTINGTVQTGAVTVSTDGVNAASVANPSTGFYPANASFDTMIRLGSNGAWGDAVYNFPASALRAGMNEIDIGMRPTGGAGNGNGFEYDCVRLEMSGYSPSPTPSPALSAVSATPSRTGTATATITPSATRAATASPTPTSTCTATSTASPTAGATPSGTATPTSTAPATASATPSSIGTATTTASPTPSPLSSPEASATASPVPSATGTAVASATASPMPSATASAVASATASEVASATASEVASATASPVPSATASAVASATASEVPSATASPEATATASPMPSATSSAVPSATASEVPSATASATARATASVTATAAATPRATATASPSSTAGAAASPSPLPGSPSLRIVAALPVPNPNPSTLRVDVSAPVDGLRLRLWSVAWRLLATVQAPSGGPGWIEVALPAGFSHSAASGTYYYSVEAWQGPRAARRVVGRLVVLH